MTQTPTGPRLHPSKHQNRRTPCPYILFKPGRDPDLQTRIHAWLTEQDIAQMAA